MLDILYPRRCPVCDDVLPAGSECTLCIKCRNKVEKVIEPFCFKCGKPVGDSKREFCQDCKKKEYFYTQGRAAFVYDRYMKKSIAAFKYGGRREYGSYYAGEIVKRYGKWIENIGAQYLIPVPIHRERYRKRGYNQAKVIADDIGRRMNIPVLDGYIEREKNTEALKNLNEAQRISCLKDAFFVSESSKLLYRDLRCVILVDDIYTTGSTISKCAEVLKKAGVKKIYFLCACIGKDDQGGE
ncbi:ComF family protein [Eubacterium sp. MSJ-13]|uniref:ComF family protein n=1 Tax=Eubacterium sp. MSJ-13 TaxID=2841513 RepID=UPI001C11FE60|nr:ComF family protein [Eubacterium sp. MSJ-13]